jgi:uncharacterized protein YbjT (DUF2867 family)
MRVLVTGANGFIGTRILAALRAAGHTPVAAIRNPDGALTQPAVACDLARDIDAENWKPRLAGVDAVVNCAGILRESAHSTFQRIHVDAPLALFHACAVLGVRRVIQVSALGAPEDGDFIASKHRGDGALAALDLDWVVLRPGLVYSAHAAYGGTNLLRALAAFPGVLMLPRDGSQRLRPVAAEDLADAVVAALARPALRGEIIELVGAQVMTLREYLLAWRQWFGLCKPVILQTPGWLARATITLGQAYGRGPLTRVIWNLIEHARTGAPDAPARMQALLGIEPLDLRTALLLRPSEAADLLEARWYTMRLLLLFILGLTWLASGVVGLLTPAAVAAAAMPNLAQPLVSILAPATSIADLALGMALLAGVRVHLVLVLMLAMVFGYTLAIAVLAPWHWLDPFGGLLKNLPVAALLIALLAMESRR